MKFDLTEGGNNCGFKYEKDLSVRSYEENEFTRWLLNRDKKYQNQIG